MTPMCSRRIYTEVNRRHLEGLVRQRLLAATSAAAVPATAPAPAASASPAAPSAAPAAGGLSLQDVNAWVDVWVPVVTRLAMEAAAAVRPALAAGSSWGTGGGTGGYVMDPRAYVKIKRLAVGDPTDSRLIVRGEVFRRNVAHRRMPTHHVAPRVVLLGGGWRV